MLYVGLLMIPKTKKIKMLYSQSQQVAALRCSAAEQVLEARTECTVRVHHAGSESLQRCIGVTSNTLKQKLASAPCCGHQTTLVLVTCACPAQMGCSAHHWQHECQTAAALWQW